MKLLVRPLALCLGFAALALIAAAGPTPIGSPSEKHATPAVVTVRDGWVRWLPAGLPAAGYLKMLNPSDHDVELTAVSSPDYHHVMLHRSVAAPNGDSRMIGVDKLRIPAGGEVALTPGGYHLMLMQAIRKIEPGATVTITLEFADGRKQSVSLVVQPANQTE